MADDFVTVARYVDPILAQMAVDVLRQEGIVATAPGVGHSGVLGAAGSMLLQISVQVRRSAALRATELIEALEEGGEVVDDDAPEELRAPKPTHPEVAQAGDGPYRGHRGEITEPTALKPVVGVCVGLFLTLGAGHFYAREKASAALLALAEVGSGLLSMMGHSSTPMLLLPTVVLVDVFGAPGAVKRQNAGQPRSTTEQLWRTGAWVAVGAALLYIFGGLLDAQVPG